MMKRKQTTRLRPILVTVIGVVVFSGSAIAQVNAQATQYYPPSPRARYVWRPATTDVAVRPAVYTPAVQPPPGVTPVTAYQPAPALVPAAGCCGQGCAPTTYAPVTYPATTTYVPEAPGVKAYRPLVNLAPPPATYTVGRGLWGQSKVYIPDQHIRNTIRYLTP